MQVLRGGLTACLSAGVEDRAILTGFVFPFVVLCAAYLFSLFAWHYPGILSPDSIGQVGQALAGSYSNHHPFWSTIVIGWFVVPVQLLTSDVNAGVAMYVTVQCVFMAACAAYGTLAMRRAGLPVWTIAACTAAFALLPYYPAYACTVWKNVPFSGCAALAACALWRIASDTGMEGWLGRITWCVYAFGVSGVALLQHNGWYALLLAAPLAALVCKRHRRALAAVGAAALVISFSMNHFLLPAIGVTPIAGRESLSIPAQQLARAAADDGLSSPQRKALAPFADPDVIAVEYKPHISDPVKWSIDENYYLSHKSDFFGLWLEVGIEHPKAYAQAWIDETKGYWFGGYKCEVVPSGVYENSLGLSAADPASESDLLRAWNVKFFSNPLFEPFRSIGLATWLALGVFAVSAAARSRSCALMALIPLCVIATLYVSTPVFSEFRYAYSLYMVLPPLLFLGLIETSVGDSLKTLT